MSVFEVKDYLIEGASSSFGKDYIRQVNVKIARVSELTWRYSIWNSYSVCWRSFEGTEAELWKGIRREAFMQEKSVTKQ